MKLLTVIRANNWLWYSGFLLSYLLLLFLAEQIHWVATFQLQTLTLADGDRMSIVGRLGESAQRRAVYVYDNDLQLRWSRSFDQRNFLFGHALSSDGDHIVYSTNLNGDLLLRTLSRDGNTSKNTIRIQKSALTAVSGTESEYVIAKRIYLPNESADSFILQSSDETFLVDQSGKIFGYVSGYLAVASEHLPKVVVLIDREGKYPNQEFSINYYSYSPEGFKLLLKVPQSRSSIDKSKSVNSRGDVVSQENDHLRISTFNQSENAIDESSIPWAIADGYLTDISDNGDAILLRLGRDQVIVLSPRDGTILSKLDTVDLCADTPMFINKDEVAFLSEPNGSQYILNLWNWRDQRLDTVVIPSISKSTKFYCDLSYYLAFAAWGFFWFWQAFKSGNTLFCKIVVVAILTVVLRWLSTHPKTELLSVAAPILFWIPLLVAWQVILSITSIWLLQSLRFIRAFAIVVILSSYATYIFLDANQEPSNLFTDEDILRVSMFLCFAAGISMVNLLKRIIHKDYPSFSIADAMLLLLSVALAIKLLTINDCYMKMKVHPIGGLSLGCLSVLLTVVADRLSSIKSKWVYATAGTALVTLLTIWTVYSQEISNPMWENQFYFGIACMIILSGLCSWALLTLVNRCGGSKEIAAEAVAT